MVVNRNKARKHISDKGQSITKLLEG